LVEIIFRGRIRRRIVLASNPSSPLSYEEVQIGLKKLSILLVGMLFAYWIFSLLATLYLVRVGPISPHPVELTVRLVYPGRALFLLLEMLVVLLVCRDVFHRTHFYQGRWPLYDVLLGAGGGVLVFAFSIPLLWGADSRLFINAVVPTVHPVQLKSTFYLLLFGLVLPVATETVFRGIVQRSLDARIGSLMAIVVSAFLFAIVWPAFNSVVSIALAMTTGLLYRWRRNLLAPILANAVMTLSAGTYVLWCIWWRY
jgi:membrane protease YdiL (CAAX protease family)